ncbi:MAG: hypothetical protein RL272_959 [Candidatus Parcubacteria bacterium]|jgi:hypothetical protein
MTSDAVLRLLDARAPSETAAHARLVAWPLFQKIARGRYEASTPARIAAADVADAISAATGRKVGRIVLSSSGDKDAFFGAIYDDRVEYEGTLSSSLRERNWVPLVGLLTRSFGEEWPKVRDEVWRALRADVASPLRIAFWDDPDRGPAVDAAENLMTALFYYVALAVAGDLPRLTALDRLVRMLNYGVPIGSRKGAVDEWIVALAPVAKLRMQRPR